MTPQGTVKPGVHEPPSGRSQAGAGTHGRSGAPRTSGKPSPRRRRTSLFAHGEPMVWLTGGALATALVMIGALLIAIVVFGGRTFWPLPIHQVTLESGRTALGEVTRTESYEPESGVLDSLTDAQRALIEGQDGIEHRRLVRTGNKDLTGYTFQWVEDHEIASVDEPEWALCVERREWGRFYGFPVAFLIDGETVAEGEAASWEAFREHHDDALRRHAEIKRLEKHEVGDISQREERARRLLKGFEREDGLDSDRWRAENERFLEMKREVEQDFERIQKEIQGLRQENQRFQLVLQTSDGIDQPTELANIVRVYPANQLGLLGKVKVYFSRWWEFLLDEPRDSNNEGGVWPAIVGTVVMTLIMSIMVVPFGVLAALYLREYAKQGTIISIVRIAVNNLAGVPSIVFGVFGLGFFCYIVGAGIDGTFFEGNLPNPTFGKGGVLWASLTLALLTLPVVIVATEEALSAVPNSMREGSYACGATKWQTIQRIVLPRAAPGIMTGMILAIARGAGEVAPLMLVGAVKLSPELPIDFQAPFIHAERSFMHLGFHIFDLGFQSPDSEAAKPMVYTTTLLLITIVVVLNLLAVWIRARLRRKYLATHI